MNNLKKRLLKKLTDVFDGEPLYGKSLMTILNSINFKQVNIIPTPSTHSIAQLVQHIIYWRKFAINKLTDKAIDLPKDWLLIQINSIEEWNELLAQLINSQNQLIKIIESKPEDFLKKTISKRDYDYFYLVEGTIQHDIYHLGQIALINKQTKTKQNAQ